MPRLRHLIAIAALLPIAGCGLVEVQKQKTACAQGDQAACQYVREWQADMARLNESLSKINAEMQARERQRKLDEAYIRYLNNASMQQRPSFHCTRDMLWGDMDCQ